MSKSIYSAKIQNVDKALNLLQNKQTAQAAKNHRKLVLGIDDKIIHHCSSSKMHNSRIRKRKKIVSSGFSRALVATEMRKCLMCHDWPHIAELLPLLLEGRIETEPLVWRYLVTGLFYNRKSTSATLSHFLKMCIGDQSLTILRKVLTLPRHTDRTIRSQKTL